jgi:tetratricopeptide (TPR) repeat protein
MNYIFLSTNINSIKYNFYIDDLSYNIKNNQTHPFIYKMLCLLYFRINNYNKAQDMLEGYLSLLPNDAYAYNFCGIINYKLNYLDKAIFYFKEAIEKKSDYYNPYYNLAVLYNSVHKTDDARIYFKKAEMVKQPDNKYDY